MKRLFVAVSFALLSVAGIAQADNASVMGRWLSTAPIFENAGMSVYLGMEFQPGQVIASTQCRFADGTVLEPSVSVPANVANGTIQVMGSGTAEMKDASHTCTAEVSPGSVGYTLMGDVLRLNAEGHLLDFTRR